MRVLYDHQVFSLQDSGGISRYYFELARNLAQLEDCEPHFFLGIEQNVFGPPDVPGIQTSRLNLPWPWPASKSRYLANELISEFAFAFQGAFDVYHPTLYREVLTARCAKMVVTHHDCAYERYPNLFKNVERIKALRRRQFEKADVIICPSESTRRDLHEFYRVSEAKTQVVYHGVSRPNGLAASNKLLIKKPFLLYVGSRASYKNFPAFLRAFAMSSVDKDFDLLVCGGQPPTVTELGILRELSLTEKVHFFGQVTESQLGEAYEKAHLLVYPSLYEGFGFPPLEAMLAGCPVLVARSSCLPEICHDAAMYFDPEQQESFVQSLIASCWDESERETRIKRGRSLASTYSWQNCAQQTLTIYRS